MRASWPPPTTAMIGDVMHTTYRRLGSAIVNVTTWLRERAGELGKFGAVGIAGVVVNLGVFNLLRLGPLAQDAEFAGSDDRVVTAKVIASLVSIAFAWVAHRLWTFRSRRRLRATRELLWFGAVNAVALGIEAGVLATSHHLLGFTTLLADNAASVIGLGLGTLARYAGYRRFVFTGASDQSGVSPVVGDDDAAS